LTELWFDGDTNVIEIPTKQRDEKSQESEKEIVTTKNNRIEPETDRTTNNNHTEAGIEQTATVIKQSTQRNLIFQLWKDELP
jgi:hypothetical protein